MRQLVYEADPKDVAGQLRCEHKIVKQLLRTNSYDVSIKLNNDPLARVTQSRVGRILSMLAKRRRTLRVTKRRRTLRVT